MLQQNVTLAIEALHVRSMYSNSEKRCAPKWFSASPLAAWRVLAQCYRHLYWRIVELLLLQ